MRAIGVAACLATAFVLGAVACGRGEGGAGAGRAGDALAYFPANAGAIVLVSTNFESEQVRTLDREVVLRAEGESAESWLRELALGVSYENDFKPLLGNDLVVGTLTDEGFFAEGERDENVVVALDTDDADKLRDVVGRLQILAPAGEERGAPVHVFRYYDVETFVAVDGDVVLVGPSREALARALAIRDDEQGLSSADVDERLGDIPGDAPVRAFGSAADARDLPGLARFRGVPWFDALESFAVALSAPENELRLDFALTTDADRLEEEDLPLVSGDETPEVLTREREITAANQNQSQTTVFLLRAMRQAYPDSRFVREVARVEEELGIDFEEEVLRQFDGPSYSAVSPDGKRFAARSEVSDPDVLREALPRLAPHLPALIEGLQGLQSEGMALLFLFAPDAPTATAMQGVRVEEPTSPEGLYHVTGLTGEGPSELYFGLVGDVFVVASDEQSARDIVEEPTAEAEGAQGAGVMRADLEALAREAAEEFGFFPPNLGELVASVEASTERLRGRVRVELR